MLGIRPIFVLEGEVPDIKQKEVKRRINATGKGSRNDGKIKRSRLNAMTAQCQKLLEALGVHSVQSPGEAEVMCAHLNATSIVDGCISQDSDCLLYGATVVYRNFSAACSSKGASFSVDVYSMARVQEHLGLNREGLVALALLCGCDYQASDDDCGRGVAGIGIETASSLILGLSKLSGNVLSRLQSWRSDPYYLKLEEEAVAVNCGTSCILCGHRGNLGRHDRIGCKTCGCTEGCKVKCQFPKENSLLHMTLEKRTVLMMELRVRMKALAYSEFPSQTIIDEFLAPKPNAVQLKQDAISWNQPNLPYFLEVAETYLGWPPEYSLSKFLPLLTRWKIMKGRDAVEKLHPHDVNPVSVIKKRVFKGIHCFEVKWNLIPTILQTSDFTTLEPCELFEEVYPLLVEELQKKKGRNQKNKKPNHVTGGDAGTNIHDIKTKKNVCPCSNIVSKSKGHICQFLKSNHDVKSNSGVSRSESPSFDMESVAEALRSIDLQDLNSSSSDDECLPDLNDDFDPLELSAIIKDIVEGNSGVTEDCGANESKGQLAKQLDSPQGITQRFTENSGSITIDELEDKEESLYLRVKHHLKKQADVGKCSHDDVDMKSLCHQIQSIDLEKVSTGDKLDQDSSSVLPAENIDIKCHLPEPIFNLGVNSLLQSPDFNKISKSNDSLSQLSAFDITE